MKNRIEVIDSLRGFSLLGILIAHCILNFSNFPKMDYVPIYHLSTDKEVLDNVLFFIGGKFQGIFALLFGLSFYIQNDNQLKKGNSFSLRFIWRMIILLLIGIVNGTFFYTEILVSFSVIGSFLPIINKLKTKYLLVLGILLLCISPICPYLLANINLIDTSEISVDIQRTLKTGNIGETLYSNFRYGNIAILYGRFKGGNLFFLFGMSILGLIAGKKKIFLLDKKNIKFRIISCIILFTALITCYFLVSLLNSSKDDFLIYVSGILYRYFSFFLVFVIINIFLILYYYLANVSFINKLFSSLASYGRMSLTIYFSQSIIGSYLYYNWGLHIGKYVGATYSLFIAIGIFFIQIFLCKLWFKYYKQGPIEFIWKKLTWLKI